MDAKGARPNQSPDLDWSQITETLRMLNLAIAQISMAMHEGEDSVASLTTNFTAMVNSVNTIAASTVKLENTEAQAGVHGEVLGHCASVHGRIQQSIIAFQFYDRLSQRLDHVREALEQLGELVEDRSRLFNPDEWNQLQIAIRRRYTMREEQEMFDVLQRGATVAEALALMHRGTAHGESEDIELF